MFKRQKSYLAPIFIMFYSKDILQKRGGKFSKIWLAATKMYKMSRREIASVQVDKSCDEILEYIEVRVELGHGRKRPRFSLYLSSMLMYGAVRIHQKQVEHLLEDLEGALVHMRKLVTYGHAEIDLKEDTRPDLVTNPELDVAEGQFQEELEFLMLSNEELSILLGRPDPEFWRMETSSSSGRSSVGTMSPRAQMVGSPQRPPQVEPVLSPQRQSFQPVTGSPHQVANVADITITEPPPVILDQIPQLDLPLMDGTELIMNLNVTDEPPLAARDLLPPASTPIEPTREKRRKPRQKQDKEKRTKLPEEEEQQEKTPARHPPEELPEARAVPRSPGVTQPIITSPLPRRQQILLDPLQLSETASPGRRRRRRQLGFADAETQIGKLEMKNRLTNTDDITQQFLLPMPKSLTVTELLNLPGRSDLRCPRFLPLWRRNAKTRVNLDESETPEASSPSDIQSEKAFEEQRLLQSPEFVAVPVSRVEAQLSPVLPPPDVSGVERLSVIDESLEALRKTASLTEAALIEDIEMPSVEQARDRSRLDETDRRKSMDTPSLIELEESIKETSTTKKSNNGRQYKHAWSSCSKRRRKTRSSAGSLLAEVDQTLQEAASTTSRSLYDLQEEQEHRVPDAEVIIPVPIVEQVWEEPVQAIQTLLREVHEELSLGDTRTTFYNLCPPALTDRKTAAIKFTALLDLCRRKKLYAHQYECYGDIFISIQEENTDYSP